MTAREIGRIESVPSTTHPGFAVRVPKPVRIAVVDGLVCLSIGTETVNLDAAGRDQFARLWFEAERGAEAHKAAEVTP